MLKELCDALDDAIAIHDAAQAATKEQRRMRRDRTRAVREGVHAAELAAVLGTIAPSDAERAAIRRELRGYLHGLAAGGTRREGGEG